jgi:hypothetical protein
VGTPSPGVCPACAQRAKTLRAAQGGTGPPGGGKTPHHCPGARSRRGRWARPSYGRVREDGTPADPDAYDYTRAARDALHFAVLFDRFVQNLRRFLGYDVQYFGAVEPQRRLAPPAAPAIAATNGNRG